MKCARSYWNNFTWLPLISTLSNNEGKVLLTYITRKTHGPAPIRRFQYDFGPVQARSRLRFCVYIIFFCDVMDLTLIADVNNGWSKCIIPLGSKIYARNIPLSIYPLFRNFLTYCIYRVVKRMQNGCPGLCRSNALRFGADRAIRNQRWNCSGPCLTTAIWRCHSPFSQWRCSFERKMRSHWLKFLWHCHVTVVKQGPVMHASPCLGVLITQRFIEIMLPISSTP